MYDKWKNENPGFKVRDSVWLEATNLSMDEPSPKLASKRHGPFKIKDKLSDLTYRLELPARCSPPPVKVNDEDFWVMEKYVDAQWFRNCFQFKIRWDGFSEEHDTWEDADDIDSDDRPRVLGEDNDNFDLEEDFYRRHPDAPKRTNPPAAQK